MINLEQFDKYLDLLLKDENNVENIKIVLFDELTNDVIACKQLINYAIDFCNRNNLHTSKAWMKYFMGWNEYDNGDIQRALDTFIQCKDLFEEVDNLDGISSAYNGLSTLFAQLGRYKISTELRLRGISIAMQNNNPHFVCLLMINFAVELVDNKKYEKANELLDHIEKEYNYTRVNSFNKFFYNRLKALIEIETGHPEKAIERISLLENLLKNHDIEIKKYKSELYIFYGKAYLKLGDFEQAEKYFELAYNMSIKKNDINDICGTLSEIAELYKLKKDDDKYVDAFNKIIKYSKHSDTCLYEKDAYENLYLFYKEKKQFEKALHYLELFDQKENALFTTDYNKLVSKLNVALSEGQLDLDKIMKNKNDIISELGQNIISILDINEIFNLINSNIDKLFKFDYFSISLHNDSSNEIVCLEVYNDKSSDNKINYIRYNVDINSPSFEVYCIEHKETVFIENYENEYTNYLSSKPVGRINDKIHSIIYIPLIVNDTVVGTMTIQSKTSKAYIPNDVYLLKIIGNYTAIAIKNAIKFNKLKEIAVYDSLTGFLTKKEILIKLTSLINIFNETKQSFCICMFDIDKFSNVNNTYGHLSGDEILKNISRIIKSNIRITDFIGRYGGDEFLMLCPNITKTDCIKMVNRIKDEISQNTQLSTKNEEIHVSVSCGVYEYKKANVTSQQAIEFADKLLYVEKK